MCTFSCIAIVGRAGAAMAAMDEEDTVETDTTDGDEAPPADDVVCCVRTRRLGNDDGDDAIAILL